MFTFEIIMCTLALLWGGDPFHPLILHFFGINFPSHPSSQFRFFTFCGQAGQQNNGKSCRAHERAPLPNWPTPATLRPPPPNTYTRPS